MLGLVTGYIGIAVVCYYITQHIVLAGVWARPSWILAQLRQDANDRKCARLVTTIKSINIQPLGKHHTG